ncbi:hypothetical protein LX36DRAFT_303006 [Colletotrichum falcatum]|nr:hypothetical protein LX36DRAFT_303006 [Colletotrichum falcatum]
METVGDLRKQMRLPQSTFGFSWIQSTARLPSTATFAGFKMTNWLEAFTCELRGLLHLLILALPAVWTPASYRHFSCNQLIGLMSWAKHCWQPTSQSPRTPTSYDFPPLPSTSDAKILAPAMEQKQSEHSTLPTGVSYGTSPRPVSGSQRAKFSTGPKTMDGHLGKLPTATDVSCRAPSCARRSLSCTAQPRSLLETSKRLNSTWAVLALDVATRGPNPTQKSRPQTVLLFFFYSKVHLPFGGTNP